MMEYIRRLIDLVRRPQKNVVLAGDTMPLSSAETLWNQLLAAKGCIKCDKLPKGFIEGPSGGVSTNVFCSQCGQGYNLTPIAQWADLIHRDEKYIVREEL